MFDGLGTLWHSLPIMLILTMFGGGLLVRLTIRRAAHPLRDYSYEPTVSILLPVYNEGAHVLETIRSIIEADWPAEKLEVIAVDDCSADDSFEYMKKAAALWPQVKVSRNPKNSGKHVSLTRALEASTGEVLICIDSDCIFDKKVIRELVACFADEKVGAVGGNIGITNVNQNVFTMVQTLVYYMSFQVGKMMQNAQGHLFCISGCLFAVRREIFQAVEEEVRTRNWFGMQVRDGEDRYMTHAIMMRGWKTIINPNAICWTAAPDNMTVLFNQQIRWRRSGLRDLFWTLRRLRQHLDVIGPVALLSALLPEMFTVIWAFFVLTCVPLFGLATALETVLTAFVMFCSVFMVAAIGYNLTVDKLAKGSEHIKYPVLAGAAGAWFFMDSLVITLIALFTFDVGSWGTRESPAAATPPQALDTTGAEVHANT